MIHPALPQPSLAAAPVTPMSIPKAVAVAMTVAVVLPFFISFCGVVLLHPELLSQAPVRDIGVRGEIAFWMSFLQNGFAFCACVLTLRRTKRYWLPAAASTLTIVSWFWLSFTMLPIGLLVVGTAAACGIGVWAFYTVRKPEVRFAFGSQFDPVDAAGRFMLSRLAANVSPTPGTISRIVVLSLSGLCVVGLLVGGTLHTVDDQLRVREQSQERAKRDAEFQGQKTKQIQAIKENIQRALTQYDVNKDMAANTLYDASGDGFYSETLNQIAGTLTVDEQQKLFQLKQMIQPRVDKRHAETEEWLRKSREERERHDGGKGGDCITADYLPHKVGSFARYDVTMFTQPETGMGMRHEFRFENGGEVDHSVVMMWTIQGGQKGNSQYVKRSMGSEKHRVSNGFVEMGSDVEGVGFVWKPYLKIGARVGDRWECRVASDSVLRYSVERFGNYNLPVNGRHYSTVTIREEIGNVVTISTYAQGIGMVGNEIQVNGRLVGKTTLDDEGIWDNLTDSERRFFE